MKFVITTKKTPIRRQEKYQYELVADNGETLLVSEKLTSMVTVGNDIDTIKAQAAKAPVFYNGQEQDW